MWLFYLYSTVKIRLLYLVFPLAESMAKAFCWLFLTMPIYVCPPLASVSGDTGTFPHPFRSFCWRRYADGALGAHPIRCGQRRRHRRHRHHGTPGTHPLRQTREAAQPGQSGLLQGLRTGNYGRPGKASTNSMVISGSASTN